MKRVIVSCGVIAWGLLGFRGIPAQDPQVAAPVCVAEDNNPQVVTCDHRVSHTSTVPANAGQEVNLFVRERVASNRAPGKAVLMVHGASVPVLPGAELRTDHYDWALWLAQAGGLDVFMLDFQGSGRSPLPDRDIDVMKDPCNVPLGQQKSILIPNPLSAPCPVPGPYPHQLINSQSDWAELDTVVNFIRDIRGNRPDDKVALVSWSQGSFRIGPYAVQHPDKVDSLLLYAPFYNPAGRAGLPVPDGFAPPVTLPQPGTPMTLTTRAGLMSRWDPEIQCEGQVEDGIQDVLWSAIMENDEIGRTWGPPPAGAPADSPPEGVMRVRSPFLWGWNSATAAKISVPVLIIYGEFDANVPAANLPTLYETVPNPNKLLFKVQCAGHFMVWERQRRVLHHISKEWLTHGTVDVDGIATGTGKFFVDTEGNLSPLP